MTNWQPPSVEIVYLDDGSDPPFGERYLMMDWRRAGSGCEVQRETMGLRYLVGREKHRFWCLEARHLARRLNLDRVYFRGRPDLAAEPAKAD